MKILSLVGPTGAGKTSVAFTLAQLYQQRQPTAEIHLVSVDSRQVYRGLEIVSGADIPNDFERVSTDFLYPFYRKGGIYLHGVACISPQDEWSVAHFQQFAWNVVETLEDGRDEDQPRLIIFVGGTGLYHASLTQFDPQLQIKPNHELRAQWEKSSLTELQAEVQRVDGGAFAKMTQSDQNNPRRLIRQLEILLSKVEQVPSGADRVIPPKMLIDLVQKKQWVTFGVAAEREQLRTAIGSRVQERLAQGAVAEVEKLMHVSGVSEQLLTATGVAEIKAYLAGEMSIEGLVEKWVTREYQYAKRQLTWWRHDDTVTWLAANDLVAWRNQIVTL